MAPDNKKVKKRRSTRNRVLTQRLVDEMDKTSLSVETSSRTPKGTQPKPKNSLKDFRSTYTPSKHQSDRKHPKTPEKARSTTEEDAGNSGDDEVSASESENSSHEEMVPNGAGSLRKRHFSIPSEPPRDNSQDSQTEDDDEQQIHRMEHKSQQSKYKSAEFVKTSEDENSEVTERAQTSTVQDFAQEDVGAASETSPQSWPAFPNRVTIFSSTITDEARSAMVTDTSLSRISTNARRTLTTLLDDIEKKYQALIAQVDRKRGKEVAFTGEPPLQSAKLDQVMSKLEELSKKVNDMQNSHVPSTNGQVLSYASVAKAPKSTLVVKPTPENDSTALLGKLKSLKCPEGAKVRKVKVLPGRLEVRCDSERDKDKLQNFLGENLKEAVVEDKRPYMQKIMLLNVSDEIDEDTLKEALKVAPSDPQLKVSHTLRSRHEGKSHWIFQTSRKNAQMILNQGFLQVGFIRVRAKRYIYVHRCKKCQMINDHHTSKCSYKQYCPKCGGNHDANDCKAQKHSCINCRSYNRAQQDISKAGKSNHQAQKYATDHAADASTCPMYRDFVNNSFHEPQ